jgi:DNA-binding LacI/PurR family transcriptional regulator
MKSQEIAKLLGISRSTVSKAINNYPDISKETREMVMNAIKEYDYFPDASARKLAGMKNMTIGIFLLYTSDSKIDKSDLEQMNVVYDNSYFSPFINAVIDCANLKEYYVLITTIYSKDDYEKIKSTFMQKRIDGGIFIGTKESDYEYIYKIIDKGYIAAFIDSEVDDIAKSKAIYVNIDNFQGSYDLVNYLISLGHKNIGIITGDINTLSGRKRLDGYKTALENAKLPFDTSLVFYGDFEFGSGHEGILKLMSSKNPPTAIFVCNDTMCTGAYNACAELGLKIPDDISIVGFDDAQFSRYMNPPLTTINVSLPNLAKTATDLLIKAIDEDHPNLSQKLINLDIVKRNSCKKLIF